MAGFDTGDFFQEGGTFNDTQALKDNVKALKAALEAMSKHVSKASTSIDESFGKKLNEQFKRFSKAVNAQGVGSLKELSDSVDLFGSVLKQTSSLTEDEAKNIQEILVKSFKVGRDAAAEMSGKFKEARGKIQEANTAISGHTKAIKANRQEIAKAMLDFTKGFGSVGTASAVTRKFGVEFPNLLSNIFSKMLDSGQQKSATTETKKNMQQYLDIIKQFNSGMKIEVDKARKNFSGGGGAGIGMGGGAGKASGEGGGGIRSKINTAQRAFTGAATSFFEIFAQAQDLAVQIGQRSLSAHFALQDAMAGAGGELGKDFSSVTPKIKAVYAAVGKEDQLTQLEAAKLHAKLIEAGFKNIAEKDLPEVLNRMGATASRLFVGGDIEKLFATESRMTGKKLKGAMIANIQTPLDVMRRVLSGTSISIKDFNKAITETYETASKSMVSKEEIVGISTNLASQEGYLRRMGVDVSKSIGTILGDLTTGFKKMGDGMKAYYGMRMSGSANPFEGMNIMEFGQSIGDVLAGKEVDQGELAKRRLTPIIDEIRSVVQNIPDQEAAFNLARTMMKTRGIEGSESQIALFKEVIQSGSLLGDPKKSAEVLGKMQANAMSEKEKTSTLVSSAQHQDKVADLQLKLQEAMLGIMTSTYLATTAGLAATVNWLAEIGSSKLISPSNWAFKQAAQKQGLMDSDEEASKKRLVMGNVAIASAANIMPQVSKVISLTEELQAYTKMGVSQTFTQMRAAMAIMATTLGGKTAGISAADLEKNTKGLTKKHLGGMIPRFHDGGFPSMHGMTSGAILRNDEIFLGGNVGKTGQVLSPQESKNAMSPKAPTIQFNGPVYGLPDFKNIVKQIIDQHVGGL